jgi:hypothetical protein
MPTEGFSANTVHRLLLTFRNGNYLQEIPMAMLLQPVGFTHDSDSE